MYAVIKSGGKQYRVEAGAKLRVEALAAEVGANVSFAEVLLVGAGRIGLVHAITLSRSHGLVLGGIADKSAQARSLSSPVRQRQAVSSWLSRRGRPLISSAYRQA